MFEGVPVSVVSNRLIHENGLMLAVCSVRLDALEKSRTRAAVGRSLPAVRADIERTGFLMVGMWSTHAIRDKATGGSACIM